MRFLAIDNRKNIIAASGSMVTIEKLIKNNEPKFLINGKLSNEKLILVSLSTKREKKRNVKK